MYALLGDVDKTFEWLELAYEQHDGGLAQILGADFWSPLYGDPRWTALLDKLGLLAAWRSMQPGEH